MIHHPIDIILSVVVGILVGIVLTTVAFVASTNSDHDPAKLLELRSACFKNDPSKFTTYYDNYAEQYSCIERSRPSTSR